MSNRPNIIIFNPDEMRADALSHLGCSCQTTPFLDSMVQTDAVSFSHAYCQNPVCVPSRCSFFTGLYPHVRGHRTMAYLLHPEEDSLFTELRRAGYYVWMNDRNDLAAAQFPGWVESQADEIFYGDDFPQPPGPEENLRGTPEGKQYYSHYEGRLGLDAQGKNYSGDDAVVDAAIARILNPIDSRPQCLFLGLMWPHPPYACEEPYFSMFAGAELAPRIKPEECSGKAKILDKIREYAHMDAYTEEDWHRLRTTYLGMCRKLDDQLARLVGALKAAGKYEDTLILFLSDHGDFTGDYGLPEKAQNTFEECLVRVPLIIKPPAGTPVVPGVLDSLTELVDFYATVMDFAGVSPSHTQYGHSLRPVLANHELVHREEVFCEGGRMPGESHCDEYHVHGPNGAPPSGAYWPKQKAQSDDEAHARGIMMRTERYKYVSRIGGLDELYDLQNDPGERVNRIHDPELTAIATEMQQKMLKWLQGSVDIVPFALDSRFTAQSLWNKIKAQVPPKHEAEVKAAVQRGATMAELQSLCRRLQAETRNDI